MTAGILFGAVLGLLLALLPGGAVVVDLSSEEIMLDPDWEDCGPQLVEALQALLPHLKKSAQVLGGTSPWPLLKQVEAALARYERAASKHGTGGSGGFLRARFGANWVLARRTPRIVQRYGDAVVCLSKGQLAKAEADYLDGKAP